MHFLAFACFKSDILLNVLFALLVLGGERGCVQALTDEMFYSNDVFFSVLWCFFPLTSKLLVSIIL